MPLLPVVYRDVLTVVCKLQELHEGDQLLPCHLQLLRILQDPTVYPPCKEHDESYTLGKGPIVYVQRLEVYSLLGLTRKILST